MAHRFSAKVLSRLAILATGLSFLAGASPAPAPSSGNSMSAKATPPAGAPAAAAKPPAAASPAPSPALKGYAHDETPRMPDALVEANGEAFRPSTTPQEAARAFDRIILEAAAQQNLAPLPLIGDDAFLRRAAIDLTGRIPVEDDRNAFAAASGTPAERRLALVRRLMAGDRFVDRWTVFFNGMLGVNSNWDGGAALRTFIIDSLRQRVPYDEMVRQMLTARGRIENGKPPEDPAVGYFASHFDSTHPRAMVGVVSQQFLGIRMSCAQCHDHPFDAWKQKDYDDIAAYFGQTSRQFYRRMVVVGLTSRSRLTLPSREGKDGAAARSKESPWPVPMLENTAPLTAELTGLRAAKATAQKPKPKPESKPEPKVDAGDEVEALATASNGGAALGAGLDADPNYLKHLIIGRDPGRDQLAELITSPRNRYFAWNVVNRLWAELVGSGIVHPVDDFRSDNPPSNARLLTRLANEFVASGYDLRFMIEAIVSTEAYQRAHAANPPDERIALERAFLAAPFRRLSGEALYDSLIAAGHLDAPKHPPGKNMVEMTYTVEERRTRPTGKDAADAGAGMAEGRKDEPASKTGPEMKPASQLRVIAQYSAEEIDTQIATAITQSGDTAMDSMMMRGADPKKAAREAPQASPESSMENIEYITRTVKVVTDDNPSFRPASALVTPTPSDHLIRQFGQPSLATPGVQRGSNVNLRQSLILFNGKMVNAGAGVGELEPMGRLMKDSAALEKLIELAYIEILCRRPTPEEITSGTALINAAPDRREGVADLRWVLLNSLEFRYVP